MKKHIQPRRYLVEFDSMDLPHVFADVLVIGTGAAGLRAAIEASEHADVLLVTKDEARESNTDYAQGGIAVELDSPDAFAGHIDDTLTVGCGLSDRATVETIVAEGPRRIRELMDWGAAFDREQGVLMLAREGGHSHPRIIHAQGDATGAEVEETLLRRAAESRRIHRLEHTFCVDLLTENGACLGAVLHSEARGMMLAWAHQTILASGGLGQIYRETTNPEVATGDGIALAYRVGAVLRDVEFVQFHPTTLYIAGASRALISEAVRGEGGVLVNRFGERFMPNYHPLAELAPRDVVSRAILKEMRRTNYTNVFLDLSALKDVDPKERFPRISEHCERFDIDIATDPIPVCPSAHYMVGGVETDLDGRSSVNSLLACGEAASSGLHGANRLGSNSLLEALVMGARAGRAAAEAVAQRGSDVAPRHLRSTLDTPKQRELDLIDVRNSLRSQMWRSVSIERSAEGLHDAEDRIDFWCSYVMDKVFDSRTGWILQNMLTVAKLITVLALRREESRGTHYRTDFPEMDDVNWQRHSSIRREEA